MAPKKGHPARATRGKGGKAGSGKPATTEGEEFSASSVEVEEIGGRGEAGGEKTHVPRSEGQDDPPSVICLSSDDDDDVTVVEKAPGGSKTGTGLEAAAGKENVQVSDTGNIKARGVFYDKEWLSIQVEGVDMYEYLCEDEKMFRRNMTGDPTLKFLSSLPHLSERPGWVVTESSQLSGSELVSPERGSSGERDAAESTARGSGGEAIVEPHGPYEVEGGGMAGGWAIGGEGWGSDGEALSEQHDPDVEVGEEGEKAGEAGEEAAKEEADPLGAKPAVGRTCRGADTYRAETAGEGCLKGGNPQQGKTRRWGDS
ncbi:hypothetical protein CLOP_g24179 [Closterium sp. NIES-67]|nr:hypothetical protein CLOP_g24179 [Closterium sp. NIES-67]